MTSADIPVLIMEKFTSSIYRAARIVKVYSRLAVEQNTTGSLISHLCAVYISYNYKTKKIVFTNDKLFYYISKFLQKCLHQ